jgi:hypothetical protein
MNTQGGTSVASEVMNKKRAFHSAIIEKEANAKSRTTPTQSEPYLAEDATDEEVMEDLPLPNNKRKSPTSAVVTSQKKRKKATNFVDEVFFLSSFQSSNSYAEKG